MKETEKDYEYLETPPEAAALGWKRITRPKSLDRILNAPSGRDCKSRITIYLDADIVDRFKEIGEKENVGYQTLINRALRKVVDELNERSEATDLKEELLNDDAFISRLREKLAA
jgi:uncharacterized protein (DUF4415 family)